MTNINKIEPLAEMALLSEIVMQSKIAERAFERLNNASDHLEFWSQIQSILISASNVSKILWPVRKNHKSRGEHLRKLLGVANDHLISDRTIRNHFEHYDERIQEWFENTNSSVYRDLELNPFEPNSWSFPQSSNRKYNEVRKTLTFRNESINLSEVVTALLEIREKCKPFVLI